MSTFSPPRDEVATDVIAARSGAGGDADCEAEASADGDADTDTRRVAFEFAGRDLVGEVVRSEPAPRFGSGDRERVTVRVAETGETLQMFAAELTSATDDL